jgi:cytoskeletal protein CcmA (bactofilin family)
MNSFGKRSNSQNNNFFLMKNIFLILVAVIMLLSQQLTAQFRSGDNVVIDEPVDHDLYVAGGTITLNAPVRGDLIIAGGTIVVNDTVTQDILVAGGNISLNGFVADDIRCAGGTIQLAGSLAGDFVVTGGQIQILKKAVISGSLLSSGGDVTLNGIVKGDIKDASGTFTLNGTAERELLCKGGKIVINGNVGGNAELAAEVIEIGSDARFSKDVTYWNEARSLDFKNSLKGGNAAYNSSLEIENGKWHYLGFASFIIVLWYLGTALVMMFLIQYLFSITLKNVANTVKDASLKSLGVGFLFLIAVPIAIVICFITLVGIPIGVLTFMAYLTVVILATIIVALLIANWINNTYYRSGWGNGQIVLAAFAIFIFLKLASLTPFIGPLVMLLLVCMAFGGILLNVKFRQNKAIALT